MEGWWSANMEVKNIFISTSDSSEYTQKFVQFLFFFFALAFGIWIFTVEKILELAYILRWQNSLWFVTGLPEWETQFFNRCFILSLLWVRIDAVEIKLAQEKRSSESSYVGLFVSLDRATWPHRHPLDGGEVLYNRPCSWKANHVNHHRRHKRIREVEMQTTG